jgi:hypothetical protein
MTENSSSSTEVSACLQAGLLRYLAQREEKIGPVVKEGLSLESCLGLQSRSFLTDLVRYPVNTFWAIPYLTIRKVLDFGTNLGLEIAHSVLPMVPRALKTDFQKEVERMLSNELFGLSDQGAGGSELRRELEKDSRMKTFFSIPEWNDLCLRAESEIRKEITEYCQVQNGFTDLAASGAILGAAQYFFGDRSLDVFAMGRRWAGLWARREATSHFFLGRKVGHLFYQVVKPPPPTTNQVIIATMAALGLLAVFSSLINVLSLPVQSKFGFQEKQLRKLLRTVEDRLLLLFAKGLLERNV